MLLIIRNDRNMLADKISWEEKKMRDKLMVLSFTNVGYFKVIIILLPLPWCEGDQKSSPLQKVVTIFHVTMWTEQTAKWIIAQVSWITLVSCCSSLLLGKEHGEAAIDNIGYKQALVQISDLEVWSWASYLTSCVLVLQHGVAMLWIQTVLHSILVPPLLASTSCLSVSFFSPIEWGS